MDEPHKSDRVDGLQSDDKQYGYTTTDELTAHNGDVANGRVVARSTASTIDINSCIT